MIQAERVLRPLDEEGAALERLATYRSPEELADSLRRSWQAVEASLRHLLRSDPEAPDDLRMSALSAADLPTDRLIPALTRRNLISLRLGGMAHELERAAGRAASGVVRAADADRAVELIELLRAEVTARSGGGVESITTVDAAGIDDTVHAVPPAGGARGRGVLLAGAAVLLLAVMVVVFALVRDDPMAVAVDAFEAGQMGVAERGFREAAEADPENVAPLLYLGRIYRRQGRYEEAASVLEDAARVAPDDQHVRRELGYLFLDLGRPEAGAQQFRRAQEIDPENPRNWIGLIRALRAAHDPEADAVLQRAPAEVRAQLTSSLPPPDTL
jgi:tetratricopeptide (TPR) repeat protein